VSKDDPFEKYQGLYRDIAFGYTRILDESGNPLFIKHLKELEKEHSFENYEIHIQTAESQGLQREEDVIKSLIKADLWTEKTEERIRDIKVELQGLRETSSKLIVKKQKRSINDKIAALRVELFGLSSRRTEAIGLTAEGFANKKQSEETVFQAFYKDDKLQEPLHTKEDFDLLSDYEVAVLSQYYAEMIFERFSSDNIKRVAISPFFMSLFHVTSDDIFNFFGKPVLQLTHFQVGLFTMGKYFKSIMQNCKNAPDHYQKSPEGLIEWYELQNSLEQAKSGATSKTGGDGGGRSVIGADKEELETLENDGEEVVDVAQAIEEHGGKMDFEEILKMHGI
jgi:hypothetical protein